MVLLQFIVVVMRYIFGAGFIAMQEGVIYLHATLFMVGAGYTLLHGGHVRVDIFYREARPRRRALVDLIGVILFLLPVCVIIGWSSWPYLEQSLVGVRGLEGDQRHSCRLCAEVDDHGVRHSRGSCRAFRSRSTRC